MQFIFMLFKTIFFYFSLIETAAFYPKNNPHLHAKSV